MNNCCKSQKAENQNLGYNLSSTDIMSSPKVLLNLKYTFKLLECGGRQLHEISTRIVAACTACVYVSVLSNVI